MARRKGFTEADLRDFQQHPETQLDIAVNDRNFDAMESLLARRKKLNALLPSAEPKKERKTRTPRKPRTTEETPAETQ